MSPQHWYDLLFPTTNPAPGAILLGGKTFHPLEWSATRLALLFIPFNGQFRGRYVLVFIQTLHAFNGQLLTVSSVPDAYLC